MPDPDLVIRTSGEHRVSNFLLWQAAYAEFVFMDVLWPDFTDADMKAALDEYSPAGTPLWRRAMADADRPGPRGAGRSGFSAPRLRPRSYSDRLALGLVIVGGLMPSLFIAAFAAAMAWEWVRMSDQGRAAARLFDRHRHGGRRGASGRAGRLWLDNILDRRRR
jgi:hypothetical protein